MVSTAISLATSPWRDPPTPSATANRAHEPSLGTTSVRLSSFFGRFCPLSDFP